MSFSACRMPPRRPKFATPTASLLSCFIRTDRARPTLIWRISTRRGIRCPIPLVELPMMRRCDHARRHHLALMQLLPKKLSRISLPLASLSLAAGLLWLSCFWELWASSLCSRPTRWEPGEPRLRLNHAYRWSRANACPYGPGQPLSRFPVPDRTTESCMRSHPLALTVFPEQRATSTVTAMHRCASGSDKRWASLHLIGYCSCFRAISSVGRAPPSHGGGRGIEAPIAHSETPAYQGFSCLSASRLHTCLAC